MCRYESRERQRNIWVDNIKNIMNKHGYNMFLSMEVPFIGVIESILRFQLTTLCHLHNAECQ